MKRLISGPVLLVTARFLLFGGASQAGLQKPDYPLFAVSIERSYTNEELDKMAAWFDLVHGSLPANQVRYLRQRRPDFEVLAHVNSSYTGHGGAVKVPWLERELRDAIAMYRVADLAQALDTETTAFSLSPNGRERLVLRASTIPGDASAASNSTKQYVTWIRVDDELMRIEEWDPGTLHIRVTRGFAGSKPASHSAGARVLSPVYIGLKGRHWSGYYPGGPAELLRYALRQDHSLTHQYKANLIVEIIREGEATGAWWDILGVSFFNQSNMEGESVRQWNFEAAAPYTLDDYRKHLQIKTRRFQEIVAEALGRPVMMVGNNFSNKYFPEDGNGQLFLVPTQLQPRPLDGIVLEGFPGEFLKEQFRTGNSMVSLIQQVMHMAQNRRPGLLSYDNCASRREKTPEEAALKEQFEEYGYAACLLAMEPNGSIRFGIAAYRRPGPGNPEPHLWLHPQYSYGIGKPLETVPHTAIERYRIPGHITYCREFERAFVFVNVSEDAEDRISLRDVPKISRDLYNPKTGATVSHLVMSPHSGVILMKR